ncbi:hypothetical protein H0E87_021741, partial [Populus deltoides]
MRPHVLVFIMPFNILQMMAVFDERSQDSVLVSKADLWRGHVWFCCSVKLRKDGTILFNSNLVQVG